MTVTAKPRSSSPEATWLMTRSMPPSSGATTGATIVTARRSTGADGTVVPGPVATAGEGRDHSERVDVEMLEHRGELLCAVLGTAPQAGDDHHAFRVAQQRYRVGDVGDRGSVEDDQVVALARLVEQVAHARGVERVDRARGAAA